MTIVMTGGGSGGHITPILAVAAEIKRLHPETRIVYIGQRGDSLGDIPADDPNIDEVNTVRAGKFRRYHGEGLKQLFDIPTMIKNIRDVIFVMMGIYQSWRLLKRLQPDVVFVKGGFVGVPVGLAAAYLHVPFVTHDSDAIPGLANRIIARWAKVHAVALPIETYSYPLDKMVTTGIPLVGKYEKVDAKLVARYRQEIAVPHDAKLLFIIGGGLGSQRINMAVAETVPHLLHEFKDLIIVHGVGRANETQMRKIYEKNIPTAEEGRVRVYGYLSDVYRYSGAANVIVTRAGATNLAEFALQGKACIVVPSPFLTGGHQLKNARVLEEKGAAVIINEVDLQADPNRLAKQVSALLKDSAHRAELGERLGLFAKPNATRDLAMLLLEQTK
jgi:UDP-N-acetylglucosamine--N-acetylmuramyl-(pentapeptide) pyrophosphoryl-undecaprenol N-acetylglucosamine transferase